MNETNTHAWKLKRKRIFWVKFFFEKVEWKNVVMYHSSISILVLQVQIGESYECFQPIERHCILKEKYFLAKWACLLETLSAALFVMFENKQLVKSFVSFWKEYLKMNSFFSCSVAFASQQSQWSVRSTDRSDLSCNQFISSNVKW